MVKIKLFVLNAKEDTIYLLISIPAIFAIIAGNKNKL